MNLLVLGGTVFLGRHFVEAALARGHEVTLFNRGRFDPNLFPELETLIGDRDGDLSALKGRQWDAVFDTSAYVPRQVRTSAGLLADSVDHYTYVSSISVYADASQPGQDERSPLRVLEDETVEDVTAETYGGLKALCEAEAERAMPGRVLTVRPGLIVGPHDPTDRFTYWVRRMARGGEVLAPGDSRRRLQLIDVRDLCDWLVRAIERGKTGAFNASGPEAGVEMQAVLEACRGAGGNDAKLIWISEAFLLEVGVEPWSEIPLWLPEGQDGLIQVSVRKAVKAGLRFRPLDETAADTLAWDQERPRTFELKAGLNPGRELALLQAWRAQRDLPEG